MGDRVSVSFENGDERSVELFHHWGGVGFAKEALDYAVKLKAELELTREKQMSTPLTRLEPRVVMVDFIRHLWETGWLKGRDIGIFGGGTAFEETGRINDSIYLGKDENDGDNSDNGHFIIDLQTFKATPGLGYLDEDRMEDVET